MIKKVTHEITDALEVGCYRYGIRTDIRSYYASINYTILQKMILSQFDDERVVSYLCNAIDSSINWGGWCEYP